MLELNDEVLTRLTASDYEGELTLGAPMNIVYPAIPRVLFTGACRRFPAGQGQLVSSYTERLNYFLSVAMFAPRRGRRDPDDRVLADCDSSRRDV